MIVKIIVVKPKLHDDLRINSPVLEYQVFVNGSGESRISDGILFYVVF